MLKLKLQYFGHLMRRTDLLEKTLMLGKIEVRRRRGRQRMRWLDDINDLMEMSLSKFWELVIDRETWCAVVHVFKKSWMWLNWTELNNTALVLPSHICGPPAPLISALKVSEFPGMCHSLVFPSSSRIHQLLPISRIKMQKYKNWRKRGLIIGPVSHP